MKKINSIWYGSKILAVGGIFTFVIPVFLYLIGGVTGKNPVFWFLIKVFAAVGVLTLVLFSLMLVIEFKQDKKINLYYDKNKRQKIRVSDELFECQNCGSRKVLEKDGFCKICGVKFIS